MVKLFVDAGMIVLTAFISPYRKDRRKVRALLQDGQYLEVYVECPPEVCAARDKKGIYAKAKSGLIKDFTGVSAPYEVPKSPDLTIRSSEENAPQSAERVIKLLEEYDLI
jgi:adenylylsulfate kinase